MLAFSPPPRYQLSGLLGHGGFSTVYKAWDSFHSEYVAIKVYLKSDDEGVKLCRQEYERTRALQHANIIQLHDFGVSGGAPFIVMPYYEKGTVQNFICELSEGQVWKMIRDVASALDFIHNLRPPVLHNDIKPDNFLVSENDEFILTDFGISTELNIKLMRSRDKSHALQEDEPHGRGPMAYLAPELFHHRDQMRQTPIKATDIWAFGAAMYEVTTGDPPFDDRGGLYQLSEMKDNHSRLYDMLNPLPSKYSGVLNNLIFDCLSLNTWDRPKASGIYQEALRNLQSDTDVIYTPVYTPPATISYNEEKNANREPAPLSIPTEVNRWPWVIAGVSVFAVVVIAFIMMIYLANNPTPNNSGSSIVIDKTSDESMHSPSQPANGSGGQSLHEDDKNEKESASDVATPEGGNQPSSSSADQRPNPSAQVSPKQYDKYHRQHSDYYYLYSFNRRDDAESKFEELREELRGYPVHVVQRGRFEWAVYVGNFASKADREKFLAKFPAFYRVTFEDGKSHLRSNNN